MTRPSLVATDLDGTLVRSDGSISDRTRDVLATLDEMDVPVIFVTGRPLRTVRPLFEHIGSHGLAIVSNGALVWDVAAAESWLERTIAPEVALEAARDLRTVIPELRFGIETVAGWASEADYTRHVEDVNVNSDPSVRAPIAEIIDQPLLKLLGLAEGQDPDVLVDIATPVVGDVLQVTHTNFPLLEMSASGVTKASTLELVAGEMGVKAADVIAFGDMPNDLQMLSWAGRSFAMADAHPSVISAATDVAPSHDNDGVARVLAGVFGL